MTNQYFHNILRHQLQSLSPKLLRVYSWDGDLGYTESMLLAKQLSGRLANLLSSRQSCHSASLRRCVLPYLAYYSHSHDFYFDTTRYIITQYNLTSPNPRYYLRRVN